MIKNQGERILLYMITSAGIICFGWATLIESEQGSFLGGGLSTARLVFYYVFLACLLPFSFLSILTVTNRKIQNWVKQVANRVCADQTTAFPLIFGSLLFSISLFLFQFQSLRGFIWEIFPLKFIFNGDPIFFNSAVSRVQPFLVWLLVFFLSISLFASARLASFIRKNGNLDKEEFFLSFFFTLLIVITVSYWLILVNQIGVFSSIPGWYWDLKRKPLSVSDFLFAPVLLLVLLFGYGLLKRKITRAGILPLCFLLGLLIQFSFGLVNGNGINSLKEKVTTSYHRNYLALASKYDRSVLSGIRDYENDIGMDMFTKTKPPGLMAGYILLEKAVNGSPSGYSTAERFDRLANAVAILFPILSLTPILLFPILFKRYFDHAPGRLEPYLAALFYILLPNQNLIVLMADQAIYPFLFLLSLLFFHRFLRSKSLLFSFLFGGYLFLVFFISYSLLPVLVFMGIYYLFDLWGEKHRIDWKNRLLSIAGLAGGSILFYFLFRVFLNYDAISHFQQAMRDNLELIQSYNMRISGGGQGSILYTRFAQLLLSVRINLIEYVIAIGIPIFLVFLGPATRMASGKDRRLSTREIRFSLASYATLAAMLISGSNYGEVARLWMFFNTCLVIVASTFYSSIVKFRINTIFFIISLQYTTAIIIFLFQDLKV